MGYRALIASDIPSRAVIRGDALQASLRYSVNSGLGDYKIHGNVMRLGINIVDTENFEGYTDCQGTRIYSGKGAIEVSASVSESEAQLVEANHGYDDRTNLDQIGIVWNRDAICSRLHGGARPPFSEVQWLMPTHDFWKCKSSATLMKEFHVRARVIFTSMRPAKPNHAALQYRKASPE